MIVWQKLISKKMLIFILLAAQAVSCMPKPDGTPTHKAVCIFQGEAKGKVTLTEYSSGVTQISGFVCNLEPGNHGFHIHEFGDFTRRCSSAGGHYNPFKLTHGAPGDKIRHVGDLGNIVAAADNGSQVSINDKLVKLSGENSVIGRSIVIHKLTDDLGKGGDAGSMATGNAGARVGCCVIARGKL